MTTLVEAIDLAAPPQQVWDAIVDWPSQGDWLLLTRVDVINQDGKGVGAGIAAWTGVGPIGFLDSMTITEWQPPWRCAVQHTGRVVRGSGVFEVLDLGGGRSRLVWTERIDLPLGAVGRLGWLVVRPAFRSGLTWSLRRFRHQVEEGS